MSNALNSIRILSFILIAGFLSMPVMGADQSPTESHKVTLKGHSPVSYFEEGTPQKGSPEYQSSYRGNRYWFTNEEQKKKFDAAPADYAPAFPHHCPYNLALGRSLPIDPTNFKIIDGQLLLFHQSTEQDGRKQWEKSVKSGQMTDQQLLNRAESNFLKLRF